MGKYHLLLQQRSALAADWAFTFRCHQTYTGITGQDIASSRTLNAELQIRGTHQEYNRIGAQKTPQGAEVR